MAITDTHPDYEYYADDWRTLRDAVSGSKAIRLGGTRYLPKPGGMTDDDYAAYKARPEWYNASRRTLVGLQGAVFRKEPSWEGLERIEQWLADVTGTGLSLNSLAKLTLGETLLLGRYGILLDIADSFQLRITLSGYSAERIVNWHTELIDGVRRLSFVILQESDRVVSSFDEAGTDVTRYRVLYLDDLGLYRVDVWESVSQRISTRDEVSLQLVDSREPRRRGERLNFIPFEFFDPVGSSAEVSRSPLLDLVNLNLRQWRRAADYEHGLHLTALPTLVITGHNPERRIQEQEGKTPDTITLGSQGGIVLSEPDAKVYMLEFTGQGLGALREALEDGKREMATLGARLLEERADVQETATAVRLRQSGDESILRSLADSQSQSFTRLMQWMSWWAGLSDNPSDDKIKYELNQDFMSLRLSAQDAAVLMQMLQNGHISYETFYHQLEQGEIAQPGIDVDEERARIGAMAPATMPLMEDT